MFILNPNMFLVVSGLVHIPCNNMEIEVLPGKLPLRDMLASVI